MFPITCRNREMYIISKSNEAALTLAESITDYNHNARIILTEYGKPHKNLKKRIKNLKCVIRSESAENIPLTFHNPKIPVHYVLMDSDENKNLAAALSITERCRNKINAEIYTFNSSKESELLLDGIYKGERSGSITPIKIRRVNVIRNQIYSNLLDSSIFDEAVEEYNEKVISVLIVGMGSYGLELLKALIWFGQMDGYVLRIHIMDLRTDIETRFYKECPGIRQRGDRPKSGEDYYELYFHPGIDVNTENFIKTVKEIPSVTSVFVSLGDERLNIETAIELRSVFSGLKIDAGLKPDHTFEAVQSPRITAVVHNNEKAEMLQHNKLSNFKRQYFQIECMGANSDIFSYKNIFCPHLEKMALDSHLQWGSVEDFEGYEYNRRSSAASAIHKKYREALMPDDETRDILEHKRYNAYMRSTEGYTFGLVRDDLARRHPLLIKYDHLSRAEKDKDKRMNFKHIDAQL